MAKTQYKFLNGWQHCADIDIVWFKDEVQLCNSTIILVFSLNMSLGVYFCLPLPICHGVSGLPLANTTVLRQETLHKYRLHRIITLTRFVITRLLIAFFYLYCRIRRDGIFTENQYNVISCFKHLCAWFVI